MSAPRVRVAIVDDEPAARATLRLLLERHDDVELAGECADGAAAVEAIRAWRPDLVFLDVQMPELDGFGVLERLTEAETPAVVFVTAYDQHALRAFEVRALDYLLKPFSDERFERALARARQEIHQHGLAELARRLRTVLAAEPGALPEPAKTDAGRPDRLLITSVGHTLVIKVDEIDWIEAADSYVRLHVGARSHLLRRPLAELETQLDPECFVRIHRGTLVNVERVRRIRPLFKGDAVVDLLDGSELKASRSFRERLLAVLERR